VGTVITDDTRYGNKANVVSQYILLYNFYVCAKLWICLSACYHDIGAPSTLTGVIASLELGLVRRDKSLELGFRMGFGSGPGSMAAAH
jgi:hypothetical protein